MKRKLTLNLDGETGETLRMLAQTTGFSPEMTAVYCIRLVGACVRDGLIDDVPARAWPAQAQALTGTETGGKVIAFGAPREKRAEGGESRA